MKKTWTVIKLTYSAVRTNLLGLGQRVLLWVLVLWVAAMMQYWWPENGVLVFLTSLLQGLAYAMTAITTHRVVLLGPDSVPAAGLMKLTAREWSFIGHGILFAVVVVVVSLPLLFLAVFANVYLISALIALVLVFFTVRLSLVFPAVATDHKWTFSEAWAYSRGHQLMLALILIIVPSVVGLFELLIYMIPMAIYLAPVVSALSTIITVAALSMAFQVIMAEAEQEASNLEPSGSETTADEED